MRKLLLSGLAVAVLSLTACQAQTTTTTAENTTAQAVDPYADDIFRISRIEIDPKRIDEYKAILKEEADTSYAVEPGVRTLFAMFEKDESHKLYILEIYDSPEQYKSHIASPWFQKYKQGTLDMVTELELIDCDPLSPAMQIKAPQAAQ
ncbi:MAG: antibiotic biosynthesis monooxygenase [Candidatus Anaerobiospirillum merdipullorum]|uniref:Antibiotic biosynthesis monooxygenase n=1 Tax=Candidatus Anaerobiospirillum merdipullorum TaxID=2838450 RepID=A0A9E2KNW6_9GAMM|nr:antibiotic biosynthesis monooxygenase [Candidatus Anaerobiospirillum merdipullorum]